MRRRLWIERTVIGGVALAILSTGLIRVPRAEPATAAPRSASASPAAISHPAAFRNAQRAMARLASAYDAGDVAQVCRPGVLIDPAVLAADAGAGQSCTAEIESLASVTPTMPAQVRSITSSQRDLITAQVASRDGVVPVDFIRHGHRWLVSFSDGADPLTALVGGA